MFQALLCPSSEDHDHDVVYHIGRVVLGLLFVGGEVQLSLSSVRAAGSSLLPGHYSSEFSLLPTNGSSLGFLERWVFPIT